MLYIKIGKDKYQCYIQPFTTQLGNEAIRISSKEAPIAEDGFLIVDDNDKVISDRSDFIYLYREEGKIKEYTKVEEEILPTEGYSMGDLPPSPVQKQISNINKRITDITPYVETKTAYIDDTEIVFENEREGNVLVSAVDQDNNSVDALCKREGNNIIVSFLEPLEQVTKVMLSIQ